MIITKYFRCALLILLGAIGASQSRAQTITFSEDFTGTSTNNSWYYFGGACLTAGTSAGGGNPGQIPSCTSVLSSYYSQASSADPYMMGGYLGYLGSSTAPGSIAAQTPDPVILQPDGTSLGYGALRFTNGSVNISGSEKYGYNERGAILSSSTFPTGAGLQLTFKTITYAGNSGGAGGDGADGISFFLQDGSQAPGLGAFGGSLAYSCSNANTPHDGLTGGYIGLGIDEYGNFLNGTNLVTGYSGTNVATGDNTAYGYGYKPGRIGLRGAGNISGAALTAAYGSNPNNTALPYYPVSLATSCVNAGGVYSATTNNCTQICSAGSTWDPVTQVCNKACTGGATYSSSTDTCNSCSSVNGTYNSTTQQCTNTNRCAAGTYFSGTASCDTCPATGYATGTYSSGTCTNSCPSGYALSGTSCYPIGAVYGSGYYCPAGSAVPTNNSGTYVCYPSLFSYSAGNYCPSGQTISGTLCYPTASPALSHSGAYYCPSGQTISGTSCFPTASPALSTSGTYYCPSGQTISGTSCYPTNSPALTHSGTYYCPISGNTISTTHCCPATYTWNAASGLCKNGALTAAATAATPMTGALAMTGASGMTASTPATVATAVTAAQTVTANQSPTLITTPVETAPATLPPSTGSVDLQYAVKNTCTTGNLYNYSIANAPTSAGAAVLGNAANTAGVLDYAPIPNAYKELTSFQIANEGATTRGAATPIFYNLKITQDGLLSFAYSVSGGAYSYVIRNQSITASNGPLPASFRVGFAGSDGGATNVHEIMCFKAASAIQSGSSATANQKEVAKVEEGPQAYFAFYNPNDWTGTVTANTLTNNLGVVSVNATANWDASCLLTWSSVPAASGGGCATTVSPPSGTPSPSSRTMLTWDTANSVGIPFEWGSLNAAQQAALDFADASPDNTRLSYLRGDRSNEINTVGVGLYRARDAVLGDIVDSSPAYIGPPTSPYTAVWRDRLYGGALPENTGTQTYLQFSGAEQTRLNVVYIGSNDGFLHGFRAGSFDVKGNFIDNATTPNDGQEVLAYMPGSTLASAALPSAAGGCTNDANTQTLVQGIHGVTPAVGMTPECTEPLLDYANTQYGHNFFVDATPGSGDLFYGGQWHTWLVGGLGAGGSAIYALDVTNPSFAESNAPGIVIGEWNPSSIVCAIGTNCGNNLGSTFGTPQIRRLHDGNWAVIFGNGFGSASGDAGIYIMSIDSTSGAQTFYYLSTNTAGGNGIAYATPADMDGDHITDYVYAGDLLGNVWRFDLTSNNPQNWAVAPAPLFTTQPGQPITTQLLVVSSNLAGGPPRFLIEFGTGQRTQITNLAPAQYASGVQSIYGIWDWNLSGWNTMSPGAVQASLPATTTATGLASPFTLTSANLQAQTLTVNSTVGVVDGTNVAVCWQGSTTCTGNSFGWYANLPSSSEQIIFNPVFNQGSFTVNSTVPANNVVTTCESNLDKGFTYALSIVNGGVFTNTFPTYTKNGTIVTDAQEAGVETDATGSVYFVNTPQGKLNIVYQTISGTPGAQQLNIPANVKAKRLTWIERR